MHRVTYIGTPACEHCGSVACSVRQASDVRARCMHRAALKNVHAAVLVATTVVGGALVDQDTRPDVGLDILTADEPPTKRKYTRRTR